MEDPLQQVFALPSKSREEETMNRLMLELELVDMEQQLYPQPPLFALLPKLPTELRLKIWRHTFPNPREVIVGNLMHYQERSTIPISMWINSESRSETRKHYFVLDPSLLNSPLKDRPVLRFDPVRDLLCMDFYHARCTGTFRNRAMRKDLLEMLSEHAPAYMLKIHHLQIEIVSIKGCREDFRTFSNEDEAIQHGVDDSYGAFLFHFPALQKITIRMWTEDSEESALDLVKEFVEHHKDRFHGRKAPEVVGVHGFRLW